MTRDLDAGALLTGRYRLERILGTGAMASVWLARDERLERPVAVKLLSDTLFHEESYLSRFRREARVAAGLSHPNLVKVYDFGGEDERPYLVMEYVEGETLARRVDRGTPVDVDPGGFARELLGALEHIHSAGVVHRDIKPGNVLITPQGGAKLTDFGIAQPEDATRLTSTGLVIGTLNYIAPEVLRGDPATARSDLYSFAMVLREAFGDPPPSALARLVASLGAEDPDRRPEGASRALDLLPVPGAPSDPADARTAPTAPLPRDSTTVTVPLRGAATRTQTHRLLGGTALLAAALLLVGVLLVSGGSGDDASSPGEERSGGQGEGSTQPDQGTADAGNGDPSEEPAATEDPPDPAEAPGSAAEPGKPEKKVKPPKPPKSPPGKAKGLDKD